MLARGAVLHLISQLQTADGVPSSGVLPLDSGIIQDCQIVIGYWNDSNPATYLLDAAQMLLDDHINIAALITHRLSWQQTADAYHLLFNSPQDALGIVIKWE